MILGESMRLFQLALAPLAAGEKRRHTTVICTRLIERLLPSGQTNRQPGNLFTTARPVWSKKKGYGL